ncbi:MAG: DUF4013 domain-containing protein [bacterium]|nr:DUF4013 domain-containing protein [bacterium]
MIVGGVFTMLPLLAFVLTINGQISLPVGVGLMGLGLFFLVISWGYLFRVFVDALNGFELAFLPQWQDWKAYALAGGWLGLIVVGYCFFAGIGFMAVLSVLGLVPSGENPEQLAGVFMLLMLISVMLYGFFPIVFARFAAERSVWAAFDPGAIWQDLKEIVNGNYIQACLGFFGLLLMGNLILSNLPIVGLLLVSVYGFFMSVVFARVFGAMIRAAKQKKPPDLSEGSNRIS